MQSGGALSTSGIINFVQQGNSGSYYTSRTNYVSVPGTSSGTSAGVTSITFGTDNYSQDGSGNYTSEVLANFAGTRSRARFCRPKTRHRPRPTRTTGTPSPRAQTAGQAPIITPPRPGNNAAYGQSGGTLAPAGASGGFSLTQTGNSNSTQASTEVYAQNGSTIASLPGGMVAARHHEPGNRRRLGQQPQQLYIPQSRRFHAVELVGQFFVHADGLAAIYQHQQRRADRLGDGRQPD